MCDGSVLDQAGLDRELLEDMLDAMDGDAAAVTAMLREQIDAAAATQCEPEPEPELSDEALAERYLAGGGDGGRGSESRVEEGEAPGVSAAMRQAEIMVRPLLCTTQQHSCS